MKIRFRFLGLKDVNWDKYEFHITPVLSFTKVIHPSGNIGKGLYVEWGHWAIGILWYKLKQN